MFNFGKNWIEYFEIVENYLKKYPTFHKIVKYFVKSYKTSIVNIKASFGLGSFPDYIIIGAQKSGTSSLQNYLLKHPRIISCLHKEVHFFDDNFDKGEKWYKAHFPISKKNKKKITGESSPSYIYHPLVAERVFKMAPKIKLIVLLRNPINRAYSHYNMIFDSGYENLSFEKAIAVEEKRLEGYDYCSYKFKCFSYLLRSKYVDQLKRWFKFFKKEQILVIRSEDLFLDPQRELSKVFKFLELPDHKIKTFKKINKNKYDKMDKSTKRFLSEYFKPYNKKLYEFLDKGFKW